MSASGPGVFRNIGIALQCNAAPYIAGLGLAAAKTRQFQAELRQVGDASSQHLKRAGDGAMVLGAAMLAGFGLGAKSMMDFEAQVSDVGAVSGATAGQLDQLRSAALAAGAASTFTATQAAQAEAELAKAGVSTADILAGGLTGALDLAAAGNIEVGRSAEIAANAMNTFSLSGAQVPHIADVLAAAANKSAAGVDDMAQAMQQTGLVADQLGIPIEDAAGGLAAFAQAGLKGSDAGTSMKTMLQRFVPQSDEARQSMRALGLEFFDASGSFVGLAGAAEQLHTKLAPLTDEARFEALQTIFGADAIRGATILYEQGAAGVGKWSKEVNQSGYAADLAAKKMDNLKGDVEQLRGSFETVLIQGGSGANNTLRSLAQTATTLVNGFGSMPAGMQQAQMGFVGVAGAVTLTVGAAGSLIPRWRTLQESLEGMGATGQRVTKGISGIATGLALAAPGVIAATMLWGSLEEAGAKALDTFSKQFQPPKGLADMRSQFNAYVAEYERLQKVARGDEHDSFGRGITELVQNLTPLDNTIADAEAATRKYDEAITQMQPGMDRWTSANAALRAELGLSETQVDSLATKAGVDLTTDTWTAVQAVKAYHQATNGGTAATVEMKTSIDGLQDKAKTAKERFDDLTGAVEAFFRTAFGTEEATDRLQSRLNQLPEIVAKAGWQFNAATDGAIAYRGLMRDIATDAGKVILEWQRQGVTGGELQQRVDLLTLSLTDQARKMGLPQTEIDKYLALLGQIPTSASTTITLPGASDAALQLDYLLAKANQIPGIVIGGVAVGQGRAYGGPVGAGMMHPVNELGDPELLTTRRGQYLMMPADTAGQVTPLTPTPITPQVTSTTGDTYVSVTVSAPNYLGDRSDLARTIEAAVTSPQVVDRLGEQLRRTARGRR